MTCLSSTNSNPFCEEQGKCVTSCGSYYVKKGGQSIWTNQQMFLFLHTYYKDEMFLNMLLSSRVNCKPNFENLHLKNWVLNIRTSKGEGLKWAERYSAILRSFHRRFRANPVEFFRNPRDLYPLLLSRNPRGLLKSPGIAEISGDFGNPRGLRKSPGIWRSDLFSFWRWIWRRVRRFRRRNNGYWTAVNKRK